MKDLLLYLSRSLVKHPEDITIREHEESDGITYLELTVHPEDMGQIIGKKGKIIRAIRDLVKVLAIRQGKRVRVNIAEQNTS